MGLAWPLALLLLLACLTRRAAGADGQCDAGDHGCRVRATKEKAFFNTYSSPEVQAKMLLDKPRTNAYKAAMEHASNRGLFRGKHVIDVGCGTGVLSLFAAAAGAKAVYCVEYTPIAEVAKEIVKANGFESVITVYKGRVEDVKLPVDTVDIIVSEWMGYFALFEGECARRSPPWPGHLGASSPVRARQA